MSGEHNIALELGLVVHSIPLLMDNTYTQPIKMTSSKTFSFDRRPRSWIEYTAQHIILPGRPCPLHRRHLLRRLRRIGQ